MVVLLVVVLLVVVEYGGGVGDICSDHETLGRTIIVERVPEVRVSHSVSTMALLSFLMLSTHLASKDYKKILLMYSLVV